MKLQAGSRVAVIKAPAGYLKELAPLPDGVELSERLQDTFDWVQVFVRTSAELTSLAPRPVKALGAEGLLWICFPKGTSEIQTDLTRDKGRDPLADAELKWVNLISVNDTWSAFCLRPYKPSEPKQSAWR